MYELTLNSTLEVLNSTMQYYASPYPYVVIASYEVTMQILRCVSILKIYSYIERFTKQMENSDISKYI